MKQISIFIENEKGTLAKVTSLLAEKEINLKALSIADTAEYGILRIIVDEPEKASEILSSAGYLSKINDVISVDIDDRPGSLNRIISALYAEHISVEYTYAFPSAKKGKAFMAFRVNDNEKAIAALKSAGINATL